MGREGPLGPRLAETLAEVEPPEPGFGAGVAVARNGALIGQAWVGEAAPGHPWDARTPVVSWSVSKGVAAMVVARLAQDGQIDPEAPIRTVWPGFGQAADTAPTLADVMTHRAGLPWLPVAAGVPSFADPASWTRPDAIAQALADMAPVAGLSGRVAYHALTYGWLVAECVRRATGTDLNSQLERLLTAPLGLEMSFGTRSADRLSRLARPGVPARAAAQAAAIDDAFGDADNPLRRALCVPPGMTFAEVLRVTETPAFLAAETPAMSLVTDAGSLARAYSLFAGADRAGDAAIIGAPGRDAAIRQRAATDDDGITGGARVMGLGFVRNSPPSITLAPGAGAFGHPGMGGSLAWGDADTGLGFAYLTNAAIPDTVTDARAMALSRTAWTDAPA